MLPKIVVPELEAEDPSAEAITAKTKIDFPEIEHVSLVNSPVKQLRPGLAKKRFSNIAFKVMTKLYSTEETDENDGTSNDKPNKTAENVEFSGNRRLARSVSQRSMEPERDPEKPQFFSPPLIRKNKQRRFASLVRLAKYRKMVRSRTGSICSINSDVEEEEKVELPQKPRFCATLSPEAQYAMLKGYEDLLLNNLKTEEKEESDRLYRVKTPHHRVVSVHLNNLEKRQQELLRGGQNTDRSERPKRLELHDSSIPTLPYIQAKPAEEDSAKQIPKDKQIWLTHRFQCAMDILDKIREEKGQLAMSPRYKHRAINPIDNYNSWSFDWSREFKLECVKH